MSELPSLPDRVAGPSVLDTLAAEAYGAAYPVTTAPQQAPPEPAPESGVDLSDAPAMVAVTHMSFDARAEFMDGFAEVEPQLRQLRQGGDADSDAEAGTLRRAAAMYRVIGRLEKLLRTAAADAGEWDAWPGRFDEHKLMALFGRYMEAFQGPEASRSSS
jgi:hypothetical protein